MYELYKESIVAYKVEYPPVTSAIYRRTFNEEYNLSFYKPKKDQCAECARYSMMTETDKEQNKSSLDEHKERNKEAQAAKATDKERAICEKTFKSVTFDFQSVLQIPSS